MLPMIAAGGPRCRAACPRHAADEAVAGRTARTAPAHGARPPTLIHLPLGARCAPQ